MNNLNHVIMMVLALQPGQAIEISRQVLSDIPTFEHNGAKFGPADRVLERIVGSAYEYEYNELCTGNVVFYRLQRHVEYGEAYVSPDRRS